MSRPRTLPRWSPYAVAAALMLAGWLNLVRGAAHPGVPYRPWAFDHHAYSDLLAMAGDRYFHGGRPTPYLEDRIEYPPLLAAALWLPSFVSREPALYFTAGYLSLALLALLSIALLARIPGARPWWLAGTPLLAYYTGLNWDHLPIALTLAGVAAWSAGRSGRAGAWLGLGAAAKLFPVALVPGFAVALLRRRALRPLAAAALAFAAAFLAVNLPVLAAAPERWRWFWTFNAGRGAENSIWEVLRHVPSLEPLVFDAPFLNRVTAALLAVAAAFAAWGAWRGTPRDAAAEAADRTRAARLAGAFVLVAWIATNKVYSPQYALYAAVAGALAAAPTPLFWALSIIGAVDYHVAFETRSSRGILTYFDAVYTAEEVLRTAVYAAMLVWLGRELVRVGRRAERPA